MRINTRAVIVRDGRLVISREHRHGVYRMFLPGGSVRDGESVPDALTRGVRQDVGIEIVPRRLLYIAEVVGVYHMHDLNLVWLADPLQPDAPFDERFTLALDSHSGYSVLPPLIEQIVADAAEDFECAPRWLGNVGRSWL